LLPCKEGGRRKIVTLDTRKENAARHVGHRAALVRRELAGTAKAHAVEPNKYQF
jgi:hypothetical protein